MKIDSESYILQYYPYNVRVLYRDKIYLLDNLSLKTSINPFKELFLTNYFKRDTLENEVPVSELKLLLRSNFLLINKCNINGESFVPICRYFGVAESNDVWCSYYASRSIEEITVFYIENNEKLSKTLKIDYNNIDKMDYGTVQLLMSWHFDPFGLLQKNIAEPLQLHKYSSRIDESK